MTKIQAALALSAVVFLYGIVARLDDDRERRSSRTTRPADAQASGECRPGVFTPSPRSLAAEVSAAGGHHAQP